MKNSQFPEGWDEKRVREVLAHYEVQTEEEQDAEIESALDGENMTWMAIPTELVPEVQAMIADRQSA